MSILAGKVAIVTGSSRGIGRETAKRLARDGASVVANYVNKVGDARTVVRAIEDEGGTAVSIQADISSLDDIRRLYRETISHFGSLDILVANAGYCAFSPVAETSEAEFDRIYSTNVKGTFFCMQQALAHMSDGGRVICISTIGTVLNLPGGAAYFGSKAAIEQFCRIMAKEVAPRGITVNVISPGFIDTEMLQTSLADDPTTTAEVLNMTPLQRFGLPKDIADTVAFLASPDANWITRQNLPVDGGIISR